MIITKTRKYENTKKIEEMVFISLGHPTTLELLRRGGPGFSELRRGKLIAQIKTDKNLCLCLSVPAPPAQLNISSEISVANLTRVGPEDRTGVRLWLIRNENHEKVHDK